MARLNQGVIPLEIKRSLEINRPSIYIAKPNKEIISPDLYEAYDLSESYDLGGMHEISFSLPYYSMRGSKKKINRNIEKVVGDYLLKVDKEWFVLRDPRKTMSEDGKIILSVNAKSLQYELRDKRLGLFEGLKNGREALEDALIYTSWTVDYVDSDFVMAKRMFELDDRNVLAILHEIEDTFGGLLQFNSDTRTISMVRYQNIGHDKGLKIKKGRYMKSIEEAPNFDDVATRLFAYGRDGQSINSQTPIGSSYIEDFSFYLHPYEEVIIDEESDSYEVVRKSRYMSDGLCHALLKYNRFIESIEDGFDALIDERNGYVATRIDYFNELEDLERELQIVQDQLDVAQATGSYGSGSMQYPDYSSAISARNDLNNQISSKISQINSVSNQIAQVDIQINEIRDSIMKGNHFTDQELEELNYFIKERVFSDNNYFDMADLHKRVKDEIKKMSQPIFAYEVGMVDFLRVAECERDWDKLGLGDIVTVEFDEFDISIRARIIKIDRNHSSNSISVVIANEKNLKDGFAKITELLDRSATTSASYEMNKSKWDLAQEADTKVNNIINSMWDANKNAITAGVDNNYILDRTGLTLKDPSDDQNYLRAVHNVLAFTNDGGNTFKHAITPTGIVGEYIFGKIIAGVNLDIVNSSGSFVIDSEGVKITDMQLAMEKNDGLNRLLIDSENGFRIDKKIGSNWSSIIDIDGSGNAYFKGRVEADEGYFNGTVYASEGEFNGVVKASDFYIGGMSVLNELNNKIDGSFIENLNASTITAGHLDASLITVSNLVVGENVVMGSNATLSWSKVTSKPTDLAYQSDIPSIPSYITSTKITSTTIESPSITGGTITGGSISSNSVINITTDANIGKKLVLNGVWDSGIDFMQGGSKVADIYYDPSAQSLIINNFNGGIWANSQRIDSPSGGGTATFG